MHRLIVAQQLTSDGDGNAGSNQLFDGLAEDFTNKDKSVTLATARSTGSKVLPPRLIEATLGRPLDPAVVATQSTPEMLKVGIKIQTGMDTPSDTHTSDHQPKPSSPRTFTAITLAALLTPLKFGQSPAGGRKVSMHSLRLRCNSTGAMRAVSKGWSESLSQFEEQPIPVDVIVLDLGVRVDGTETEC